MKNNIKYDRFNIRSLPDDERPYEKCLASGPDALSDAELLAVIIRCGSKDERADELACRILDIRRDMGLAGLYHLDLNSLTQLKGIGKVKAVQILCIAELSKRMARSAAGRKKCFTSADDIAAYYMESMRHLEHEETIAVFFDGKMNLIGEKTIFKGTVNLSMFEPREILIEALRAGAVNIVMLHNHPTGDPTPSNADISATTRLKQACLTVGLRLADHIIIGDNRYVSMHESGVLSK